MKRLVLAALAAVVFATSVAAQPAASSAQEQVERTIGNLVISNATLQDQVRQAQATIAALQKELAAAKAAPQSDRPPAAKP